MATLASDMPPTTWGPLNRVRTVRRILTGAIACVTWLWLLSCESGSAHRATERLDRHGSPESPYAVSADDAATSPVRDTIAAQRLTREAAEVIQTDREHAEQLLRKALEADLFYGPAHNNLGIIALGCDEFYEAASEFEWARKLMPGHPGPRMNLAFTLECVGRTDDAVSTYETALEVYPNHLPTLQALTRLLVRERISDERIPEFLDEIAMRSEDATWREWAQKHQVKYDAR